MDDLPVSSIRSIWNIYKIPILLGGMSCFFIFLALVLMVRSLYSTTPIEFTQAAEVRQKNIGNLSTESANLNLPAGKAGLILVDIEGAVVHPGVVSIPVGSRVEDSIQAAGGFTKDADNEYVAQQINRAMKVGDGMKIYIPSKNETSHNISPLLQRSDETSQNGGGVDRVSINMASKEQLESLPGVGPVTAQKIIDNRSYQTIEELVSKKAVGQALFEKIKGSIGL